MSLALHLMRPAREGDTVEAPLPPLPPRFLLLLQRVAAAAAIGAQASSTAVEAEIASHAYTSPETRKRAASGVKEGGKEGGKRGVGGTTAGGAKREGGRERGRGEGVKFNDFDFSCVATPIDTR
ncbi:hypothetical protein VYU27_010813, partial [Nannochloropsis oceanica]